MRNGRNEDLAKARIANPRQRGGTAMSKSRALRLLSLSESFSYSEPILEMDGEVKSLRVPLSELTTSTLKVYPNPALNMITVSHSGKEMSAILLLDATGRVVLNQNCRAKQAVIDLNDLQAGLYFLRVHDIHGLEIGHTSFIKL